MKRIIGKKLKKFNCDYCNIDFESDEYEEKYSHDGYEYKYEFNDECPKCKSKIKISGYGQNLPE